MWVGEVKGIQNWLSIFYTDIANSLSLTQSDFIKCFESPYKEVEACQYFSCDFVREIYISELNKETNVCISKCKAILSKHISSEPFDVWAVVQKINLTRLVVISTQLTALVQQEYLEPATISQLRSFLSRILCKLV